MSANWITANLEAQKRLPKICLIFGAMVLVGLIGFTIGSGDGNRSWEAYWVNFLFFGGLAQGGVILAAVVNVAKGKWGGPLVRFGLMNVAFLPVTLLLFVGIAFSSSSILPWVSHPVAGKEWWLNQNFFFIRMAAGFLIMMIMSFIFAYFTLRPEAGAIQEQEGKSTFLGFLTKGWKGAEIEKDLSTRRLRLFTPVFLFVYGVVYSFVGFDMVMSLSPHWFSTLFGAYYFITSIYMGMAAVVIVATLLRKTLGLENSLTKSRFHDLGTLLFGFCILSTDFLWSQFLVIYYGDLPEVNFFILDRITEQPWHTLSWIVLFAGFVIPFILLLIRKVKENRLLLSAIALIVLIGGFIERAVMVIRSLRPESGAPFPIGYVEIMITIGFLGIYLTTLFWMIRRAPLVPENSFEIKEH
jgi:Ni/Fe-hydrogenase subunit HybB-like protein